MKITLVKKMLADGSACKKCKDVLEKLEQSGQINRIDEIVTADEKDPNSRGVKLAAKFNVNRAPFFIVEEEGREPVIYSVYLKFVKEILNQTTSEVEEIKEIMNNNPDLDYL